MATANFRAVFIKIRYFYVLFIAVMAELDVMAEFNLEHFDG